MAHSLKGICMNLGLQSLQEAVEGLTENLRGQEPDENTPVLFDQVKQAYNTTISAIQLFINQTQ